MTRSDFPAIIVSMPFMDIDRPSIQLGLLSAVLRTHGFEARTLHANLDFAARIGHDLYRRLAEHRGRMLGDWLFSVAAFGDAAPDHTGRMLREFVADLDGVDEATLRRVREHDVPAYLDELLAGVAWDTAHVVGFSCVFAQNTASFALAARLKQRFPHLVTVFGGANFDGEMGLELVRSTPCIDFAVIGEGDEAFPRLLAALADGSDPTGIPGVATRCGDGVVATPAAPPIQRLDALPMPDYEEYFTRAEHLGILARTGQRQVWLPLESARGCWWGAKHHCTFCGLNSTTMQFRAKSPQRVFDELAALARRYRSFRFQMVDNILDPGYLNDLLPSLVAARTDYEIFYEVKANLTRAHLRLMAQAGITSIQPGLESLSSSVLRLMRKGVRAAQNVNLLRWSRYYGIDVGWNILWGFPGEQPADYRDQAAAVPHLVHLQPPGNAGRIWLERFSPLFTEPALAVTTTRRPEASYRHVYPAGVDLDQIAYFFEYELLDPLPPESYAELTDQVRQWRAAWQRESPPTLTYRSAPGFLQIRDDRHDGRTGTYTFEGTLAEVYLACGDRPMTAAAVRDRLDADVSIELIGDIFGEFHKRGLMFLDGSLALSLALPAVAGR